MRGGGPKNVASIYQQQFKVQMQQRKRLIRANKKPLDFFDQECPMQSNQSNVLDAIKNQDLYLKIVAIALQVSRQAGVSESALEEVECKLLAAKGYQEFSMLSQDKNKQIRRVELENKNIPYTSSKKYITPEEQLAFLAKMEKQVVQVQAKEHVIYALKKYIEQKKKTIPEDGLKSTNLSRINAFLQKARAKSSQRRLQRCNFYGQTLRQIIGRIQAERVTSYETVNKMVHLKTVWGHTFFSESEEEYCPVYNVIFDNTQKLIITGGEDGKIKVWARNTGSLLSTLQGHKDYINKICVTQDNKTILSAAQDGVRFFDLENMNSLGGYKTESIMDIGEVIDKKTNESSVIFANQKKLYVLPVSTIRGSKKGKIETYDFKIYNFASKLHENSVNTTTLTITPEGMVFLGFSEGQIIMFDFHKLNDAKPQPFNDMDEDLDKIQLFQLPVICVLNAHQGDVLEIKWNPFLSCFNTGAKKDGVCKIWQFRLDEPDRRPVVVKELKIPKYKMKRKKKMYNCNFGCWNSTLTHLTCSFEEQEEGEESQTRGDGQVLVYNAMKMQITWQMSKTVDLSSIRAMDSHPFYPNVMVICDSYGKVIIVDIYENCVINIFEERAFHLNHPSFCLVPSQCRFSRDGLTLLVATQYGNYSIYGYDIKQFYQIYPTQQLFENDYEDFHTDPLTFKPVLQIGSSVDINDLNSGVLQNMRRQAYKNLNKIDACKFISTLENVSPALDHHNACLIDTEEVEKIGECLHEYQKNMEIFKQNMEQIQSKRMAILFEERQLKEARLKQIINEKLQRIKQVDQLSISLLTTSFNSTNPNSSNSHTSQVEENHNQNQVTTTRRRGRRPAREVSNPTNIPRRTTFATYQQNSSAIEDQNSNGADKHDDEDQYEAEGENEADEFQQYQDQDEEDEEDYDDQNSENQSEDVYLASRSRKRRRINRTSTRPQRNLNVMRAARRPAKDEIEELQHDFELELGKMRKRQCENNEHNEQLEEQDQFPKNQIRRAASRAINQMGRERDSCKLCMFKESSVSCHQCRVKKYCDGCKNFRGKRVSDSNSYICFQCYFNKNSSPENHKNVSFEKYVGIQRNDLFIPQVGDEVVYFFQGYEQFLYDKIETLNNKYIQLEGNFDIIPHENHPELINVQKCEVIKIDFAFPLEEQSQPSYKNMNNRRGRIQKSSAQDILAFVTLKTPSGLELKVFFTPGYDYLIKWEIYDDIIKNDRYGKFNLYDIVRIKSEEIQIEEIRPLNELYTNSIWKNIIVHKAQTKYLRTRDKTQDIAINIWNIDGLIDESAFKYRTTFTPASREHYQREIAKIQFNEPGIWEIFYHPVDIAIYPTYHTFVEVSMCLELILERLRNNYYASERSFEADVRMLTVNSISFNSKQNSITGMSEKLVKLILQGENSVNNHQNQNSTEKKTKPKRKFNSGSSMNKDNEDQGRRKNDVKVSKFSQQNEIVPNVRRIKRVKYTEKNSDDDYKQESGDNYDGDMESSQVQPATRTRRKQENQVTKKQVKESGRVTRSRAKN